MDNAKKKWLDALGNPSCNRSSGNTKLIDKFSHKEFDAELYIQETNCGKNQRVMIVLPKNLKEKAPAIAVPFYFPEAMLGFDPATDQVLEAYKDIEMMLHLVRRGYVTVCADSYHLTYIDSNKNRNDFTRWQDAANQLLRDNPNYSGMGKLFDDTELLVDILYNDTRVDNTKIGIAGHSLGGKMAFYTGCLDDRICAILASDFGIGWDQTNWRDIWYWANQVDKLIANGMDHSALLSIAAPKPFCLLAGKYDNEESYKTMLKASGYENAPEHLIFINHASGHRPPLWALEEGYDFLDRYVKNKV